MIQAIERAAECGARHVISAWHMTLRDRQRSHCYAQLDRLFPGLREKFERSYGDPCSAGAPNTKRMEAILAVPMEMFRLERAAAPWLAGEATQLTTLL